MNVLDKGDPLFCSEHYQLLFCMTNFVVCALVKKVVVYGFVIGAHAQLFSTVCKCSKKPQLLTDSGGFLCIHSNRRLYLILWCFITNLGLNKAIALGMINSAPSILKSNIMASSNPIRAWNIIFERNQNAMPQTKVTAM